MPSMPCGLASASAIAFAIAVSVAAPAGAQRTQLSAEPLLHIPHRPTQPRMRFDPVRRTMVQYAVDGAIEPASNGDFLVSWNGADGSRHRVVWEPPNKLRAEVAVEVTFDAESRLYTYSYAVHNSRASQQSLRSLYVQGHGVTGAESPDDSWYSRTITDFVQGQLGIEGWAWSRVLGSTGGVRPGESASGHTIVSRSGPAVVRTFVSGHRAPLKAQEDIPDELVAALDQVHFRFPSGLTIGPAAAPSVVEERQFERVLRLLLDEPSTHGWLGGPETSGRIRSVLTQVARARAVSNEAEVGRLLGSLDSRFAEGEYGDVLIEGRSLLRILGALH